MCSLLLVLYHRQGPFPSQNNGQFLSFFLPAPTRPPATRAPPVEAIPTPPPLGSVGTYCARRQVFANRIAIPVKTCISSTSEPEH